MVNRTRTAPPARTWPGTAQATFRGPFARWPRAADAVLAGAAFLMTVFVIDGPKDSLIFRSPGDVPLLVLPPYAAACLALYRRRRAPLVALGVTLLAWVLTLGFVAHDSIGIVAIIALYSVGRYAGNDRWEWAGVAATIAMVNIAGLIDTNPWQDSVIAGTLVMFGSWYVGRRVRLRHERAARLLREQAAEARRILIEERTRIARELHDVVAHRVSLMTVQAAAAKAVAPADLDAALQAMGAVEEAGRQALGELRHLLGVLRPTADADSLGPQPGLADLPKLIEEIRGAGVDVKLEMNGVAAGLPARVDLFAYRIVQEALTNVLKHAGKGTRVEVRLAAGSDDHDHDHDHDGIVIEVLDDGHGTTVIPGSSAAPDGTTGHGIVGMRERALLLGGTLEAGPRPGGGFQVLGRLPTGGEPA